MSTISDFASGLLNGPYLRDWQHANKIFTSNNYALKPKDSFLFHIWFDINTQVCRMNNQEQIEMGVLAKTVQIPKFTLETKTMNAYNRKSVVQQAIKYDPITITFHDDSSNVIRDFWYDYYYHHYRDTDYAPNTYTKPYKYAGSQGQNNFWGYQPATYDNTGSERYLNAIHIFSLHQKRYTEYVLVNPMITSFSHGQHQQGANEFLENTMTIAYESVLYGYGPISAKAQTPKNFTRPNYDKTPSPLTPAGGGTNSIFGPGGLANAVGDTADDISSGNWAAAAVTAARGINTAKNSNLATEAKTELNNAAKGILAGDTNTLNRMGLPTPAPTNLASGASSVQE